MSPDQQPPNLDELQANADWTKKEIRAMESISLFRCSLVRERTYEGPTSRIRGPDDAAEVVRPLLRDADREHFLVLLLDTQHQVIGVHVATVGTLDSSLLHPREVFKASILASAAAILVVHNHLSGDPTPSPEDRAITRQLIDAGQILGIPVLDHVVIGDACYVSFVEAGLMTPG